MAASSECESDKHLLTVSNVKENCYMVYPTYNSMWLQYICLCLEGNFFVMSPPINTKLYHVKSQTHMNESVTVHTFTHAC